MTTTRTWPFRCDVIACCRGYDQREGEGKIRILDAAGTRTLMTLGIAMEGLRLGRPDGRQIYFTSRMPMGRRNYMRAAMVPVRRKRY